MNVLGIDASLNGTGLCLSLAVPGIKKREYRTGLCKFQSGGDPFRKWKEIVSKVLAFSDEAQLILIEDYAYGAHSSSTTVLAELGGIIRWELRKQGREFTIVSSSVIKKFLTGKGSGPKNVLLKDVYRLYRMNFDDDNLADSFALAKVGEAYLGEHYEPLFEYQLEAIKTMKKNLPVKAWE